MGKGVETKILPQSIYPLWGRDTIPIDGVDAEAPKSQKRGPIQCNGRLYSTMGDGCYSFCSTRWEHCPYSSDLILPGLSSFTVPPD